LLGALKGMVGDLNEIERIIKMNGYAASTNNFKEHSKVINAASALLNDIFGEEQKHVRMAIGEPHYLAGAGGDRNDR